MRLVVLLGQEGQTPTDADEVDFLQVLKIERSSGADRVDSCLVEYDFDKAGDRLEDIPAPLGLDRQLEVRELDEDGEVVRVLFWGLMSGYPLEITEEGEGEKLLFRLDKHLFGDPLDRLPFASSTDATVVSLDRPIVFNPEIDETIEPNRSDLLRVTRDNMRIWLDPESMRTAAARTLQEQTASLWDLPTAVHSLCWECNPNETWIKNPKLVDLQTAFAGVPADVLKNHKLKAGQYLPKLLQELLEPYGCSFWIQHTREDMASEEEEETDMQTVRRLRFYRQGTGAEVDVYLQRPGESLDTAKSSVAEFHQEVSLVDLANHIEARTSLKLREATFPLKAAWSAEDEVYELYELREGTDLAKEKPHVGRKMVLDTAGDYIGLRSGYTTFYDLSTLFGTATIACRRKFLPCLSRDSEKQSRGIYLEWKNQDGDWEKVRWEWQPSLKECAVLFGGSTPPPGIWEQGGAAAEVRITCTLEGDSATRATATRQASSPNGRDVKLKLDLSDKFHDRQVDSSSIFYADPSADTKDDAAALQSYVEQMRGISDFAEMSTSVQLEGLDHPEYEIGKVVRKLNGRNISLDANAPGATSPRRLQIVGITLDPQSQRTELLLETLKEERLA